MTSLPERILVTGPAGSGKSYSAFKIAELFPDKCFYLMDTDSSAERLLSLEFPHLQNVTVYPAIDWPACQKFADEIKSKLKPGDWIIIDSICSVWEFVQAYFVSEVFKEGIGEYFLSVRKTLSANSKRLDALKGWTDWVTVNKLYQELAHKLFYAYTSAPYLANIYAVAKATKLSKEDDQEMLDSYSLVGYKPEGEKRNAFRVHTLLLFTNSRNEYFCTTIKDRGRNKMERQKVTDFGLEYGMLAGWF